MTCRAITNHALDRYKERAGASKDQKALNKLFALADSAIPIGRDQFYAQGWILVIRKSVIRTCYRPKTPAQLTAVHQAVQKNRKK